MEEKIRALLNKGINPEEFLQALAKQFYGTIEDNRIQHRVLYLMLNEYETFTDYFRAENDDLDETERMILRDMEEDFSYLIDINFDDNEDMVTDQLLKGHWAAEIKEDLKARGIVLMNGELTQDDVESAYAEVYADYDRLHAKFLEKAYSLEPKKAYDSAAAEEKEYREKHHILFDDSDFIEEYSATFSKKGLWKLLRERLQEAFKYSQHYTLLVDEDDELGLDDEPGDEENPEDNDREILDADGPLKAENYEYVFQLMTEYTGRRVIPEQDGWGGGAYWTTYEDDFQELISYYILDHFEETIDRLSVETPSNWASFGRQLGLEANERNDATMILDHSDRINYFLSYFIEQLWTEFTETKVSEALKDEEN